VGSHPYGYTGFAVDLTDDAHTDGSTPNVLAVQVRNQLPSSRWYSGSGIYRHVHLVVTNPVHVARHGTFVTTPDVEHTFSSGYADVHVATKVVAGDDSTPVTVLNRIVDARGRTVAVARSDGTAELRVSRPHLWSTDDPYLYTLRTAVVVGHRVVDRTSTRFGIRWFRIDPNQGLFLNGKYMKVQGVDLHTTSARSVPRSTATP
jgi:beta-galactosidase